MDAAQFDSLVREMKSCTFASSKRKCINKVPGVKLAAGQVYILIGQFTSSNDRKEVVKDLHQDKKLLPMSAMEAGPIVGMGIYSGAQKSILQNLSTYIVDRHDANARNVLRKPFESYFDKQWVDKLLNELGPYVHEQINYPPAQYQYPPQHQPAGAYMPPAGGQYPVPQPPAGQYQQPPAAVYMPHTGQYPPAQPTGAYPPAQPTGAYPPPVAYPSSNYPPVGPPGAAPQASAPLYPDLPADQANQPQQYGGYPQPYPGQAPPPYAEKA